MCSAHSILAWLLFEEINFLQRLKALPVLGEGCRQLTTQVSLFYTKLGLHQLFCPFLYSDQFFPLLLLPFFFFFLVPCGMQHLSSRTRDQTHVTCIGSEVLTTEAQGHPSSSLLSTSLFLPFLLSSYQPLLHLLFPSPCTPDFPASLLSVPTFFMGTSVYFSNSRYSNTLSPLDS